MVERYPDGSAAGQQGFRRVGHLWASIGDGAASRSSFATPTFIVTGQTVFYRIQIGHRIGYVDAADVTIQIV
jgi:hypothetical protein